MELLNVAITQAGYIGHEGAVQNISFTLNKGEVIGLIGPNGAGKSTIIKAIAGLLPEMTGQIDFVGQEAYAYIPDQPVLYEELTLWEHLELAGAVKGMKNETVLEKGETLLGTFDLQEVKHHFPSSFSKGMQQKVMIILGLLMESDVYIIDEPFVGLDPRATMEFMNFLLEESCRGAGIILSTHQLDFAERICDYIILMVEGRIVSRGSLEEIRKNCGMLDASLFDCFNYILEKQQ